MIELTLLGAVRLTRDGRSQTSVLAQPKRVALLAVLALAPAGTFRRRDELLPMFWPDYDEARARAALNTAVHYLRRALGAGVLVSRGKEELGLTRDGFWCDAAAFDVALGEGELESALGHYVGDLLPGFHLAGADGFERWLEGERSRLRQGAFEAATALADHCMEEGRDEQALGWARKAVELSTSDEPAVRRLMILLEKTGDRATALEEFERYRSWVSERLGVEPSNATRELAGKIRHAALASTDAPEPARAPDAEPGPPAAVPSAPPGLGLGDPAKPAARRRRTLAAVSIVAAAMVLAYGASSLRVEESGEVGPTRAMDRVVVLPFQYQGAEEFAYLGEGLADLLAVKLDLKGGLQVVDPQIVIKAARLQPAPLGLPGARAIAVGNGAGWLLRGSILEAGGDLQLSAALYEGERQHSAVTVHAVGEAGIFPAVDQMAASLLVSRLGDGEELARTAALTTSSLAALKAYLQAETAFRAGRHEEAVAGFEHAATIDTSFALAHYRVGLVADWAGRNEMINPALDRAWRWRDRLPGHIRLLIEARIRRRSHPADAERLLRRALNHAPHHVETLGELADLWFHNPLLGGSPEQIRSGFERVLTLDSANLSALVHLARLAAFERDAEELGRLVALGLEHGAGGEAALEMRALRAFALDDDAERSRVVDEFRELTGDALSRLTVRTINYSGNYDETRALADLLREPARPPEIRALGAVISGSLDMAHGRFADAGARFDSAAAVSPRIGLIGRTLFTAAPIVPADSAELRMAMVDVANWERLPVLGAAHSGYPLSLVIRPQLPALIGGLVAARTGHASAALRHASALDAQDPSDLDPQTAATFAQVVRSAVALHGGSPAHATRLLSTTGNGRSLDALGLQLLTRAATAEESGRFEEARGLYRAMTGELPLSFGYRALSHLRLAEAEERLGADSAAAYHYARFAALWEGADSHLQPLVLESMLRARRLSAKTEAGL